MFRFIQQHQPVSMTGFFAHSMLWLTSASEDVVYHNPAFQLWANSFMRTESEIAIYCIHGTADRSSAFSLIANRILPHLPPAVASIHLLAFDQRGEGKSIEEFGDQVINKILKNKHKKVILMGHSRGGLIAAFLATQLAKKYGIDVLAVISICAPFLGSLFALPPLSWLSTSVKQMEKNSTFLTMLADAIRESEKKYYYFAAENDLLVSPESAVIKENCCSFEVLDRHGHLSIMSSHRLVESIRKILVNVTSALTPVHEKNEDDVLDDFIFIKKDEDSPLENSCLEIYSFIEKLIQQKDHNTIPKSNQISVLSSLVALLSEMLDNHRGKKYPDAHTIGDFIQAFLLDDAYACKSMFTSSEGQPMILTKTFLAFISSNVNHSSCDVARFIENLIQKYGDNPLPQKLELGNNTNLR